MLALLYACRLKSSYEAGKTVAKEASTRKDGKGVVERIEALGVLKEKG